MIFFDGADLFRYKQKQVMACGGTTSGHKLRETIIIVKSPGVCLDFLKKYVGVWQYCQMCLPWATTWHRKASLREVAPTSI